MKRQLRDLLRQNTRTYTKNGKICIENSSVIPSPPPFLPPLQLKASSEYFTNSHTTHRSYAFYFLLCECLGFVIAVSNLFFTNAFLGGNFFSFGPSSIKYLSQHAADPDNPLNEIFPKVSEGQRGSLSLKGVFVLFCSKGFLFNF